MTKRKYENPQDEQLYQLGRIADALESIKYLLERGY